jgi:leucyl aminopeptidase
MKIQFSNKAVSDISGFTAVRLTEKKLDRVVVDGGKETLNIGIGPKDKVTYKSLPLIARQIIATAKKQNFKKIAIDVADLTFETVEGVDAARIVATNFELANYDSTMLKTMPEAGWPEVVEVTLCGAVSKEGQTAVVRGQAIGKQINIARDWCNMPGGDMTPTYMARVTKAAAKGTKATVKVLCCALPKARQKSLSLLLSSIGALLKTKNLWCWWARVSLLTPAGSTSNPATTCTKCTWT